MEVLEYQKGIIIKIDSGDEYIYNHIDDIKPEYYDKIIKLSCSNCNLSFLPFFPNLEELYCVSNKIIEIPLYPKLKELTCNNNLITSLGYYPLLKNLYCSNNHLSKIESYPVLELLTCSRNKITLIGDCPLLTYLDCRFNNLQNIEIEKYPNLETLNCQMNELNKIQSHMSLLYLNCIYNRITEIGDLSNIRKLFCYNNLLTVIGDYNSIETLDCSNNRLKHLPNILDWNNLVSIIYAGNEIDYIAPNIIRRLTLLDNINKKNNNLAIYNDNQNVHNHNIQKSIIDSIQNVISVKPDISLSQMMNEILSSKELTNDTKNILIEFSNDLEIHSILGISFNELLLSVWCIIRKHDNQLNILNVMNIEMNDSICKCFTGRISRLINCLNGFDSRVSIMLPDNVQIGNIIIIIKEKLEKKGDYTIKKHRELVLNELTERGFSSDISNIWIENIE
jgi:hypothetical protein